ncbi:MAG TPA: ABC transporter ATP-binding protein [Candidatus Aquilonibacter sp.]|nr:ABC transporter ATP-binding protein [Candidatus Aquilonibacter sp.]
MAAPAIEFSSVTKTYRRRFGGDRIPALSQVSFEVARGEVCAFLGPNGAGKTTSMSVLMGFTYADEGESRVFGYPPGDVRAKERIGFVPENFAFYRYLTAETLMQFHLRLSGRKVTAPEALIAELIAKVKLDGYKGLKVGKYSRGMVQRLGIAQALVGNPELLILDEPTSGLDPAGRKEVRDLILSLKAEGKSIFLSSHILSEVEQVCDRVIIIDRGRLVRSGALQEMLAEGNRVEIIVDQLPESLAQAARELGATLEPEAGRVRLSIEASKKRVLAETLWAGGSDILSLTPLKSSLEDTFLKLVGGGTP